MLKELEGFVLCGNVIASESKQCPECLSNIPKGAKRCAFCTSAQAVQV